MFTINLQDTNVLLSTNYATVGFLKSQTDTDEYGPK